MIRASQQDGHYPRPQLVRDRWTSLDGEWDFAFDDDDRGLTERWHRPNAQDRFDRTIVVPFVPESAASGLRAEGFHPVVWYRRTIPTLSADDSHRHILHFGAVDQEALVWVDGTLVATHIGGQTGFNVDITDALDPTDSGHTIVVRAFDDPGDSEVPRGKQDWRHDPHFIWYRRSTGIWKTVWLETVARQHVQRLDWTSDSVTGTVTAAITLARPPSSSTEVAIYLSCDEERLARVRVTATARGVAVVLEIAAMRNAQERERLLWSPDQPTLIDAEITVHETGAAVDRIASYVGIRSVGIHRGNMLLNGHPIQLLSVLEQGYWPDSQLTAPDAKALRHEVELIRDLGFNCARLHQKAEDPRFLYWADRLGLLIWCETAAAYEFTPRAAARLVSEWTAIVELYRNHPSVVTWVPMNESWGAHDIATRPDQQALVRSLVELTRALDPTRPVISNDGWEHVGGDILTLHDYHSDPAVIAARYRDPAAIAATLDGTGPQGRRPIVDDAFRARFASGDVPLMITEFGGVSYSAHGTWGYTTVTSDEGYADHLRLLFSALRACPAVTGICYTQLTDTMQENNGLLTANRTPKLPIDVLRQIVTDATRPRAAEPMVDAPHIERTA